MRKNLRVNEVLYIFLAHLYVSRMKLKQKKKRADTRVGGEINEEEENGKE